LNENGDTLGTRGFEFQSRMDPPLSGVMSGKTGIDESWRSSSIAWNTSMRDVAVACRWPELDLHAGRRSAGRRGWTAMHLVLALLGALCAALGARTDLVLENLALRQQLALLRRRSKCPRFG